jgi:hypothetical protein
VLSDSGLEVVVDDPRLHDAQQVVRLDRQHPTHPRQIEDHAPVDGVGPTGQAGARASRHDGDAELSADRDHVLNLCLGPGPHSHRWPPDDRPRRLIARQAPHHVGIQEQAVGRQASTEGFQERFVAGRQDGHQ